MTMSCWVKISWISNIELLQVHLKIVDVFIQICYVKKKPSSSMQIDFIGPIPAIDIPQKIVCWNYHAASHVLNIHCWFEPVFCMLNKF